MASFDDNTDCSCGNDAGDSCFVVLSLMKLLGMVRFELLLLLELDGCGLEFVCMTTSSISSVLLLELILRP